MNHQTPVQPGQPHIRISVTNKSTAEKIINTATQNQMATSPIATVFPTKENANTQYEIRISYPGVVDCAATLNRLTHALMILRSIHDAAFDLDSTDINFDAGTEQAED